MGRLESGMRVSARFQIIPSPVGRLELGPGPHVVDRLGSGPRVEGRLGSEVRVSASFEIFALTAGGRWRGKLSGGDMSGREFVRRGNVLTRLDRPDFYAFTDKFTMRLNCSMLVYPDHDMCDPIDKWRPVVLR